MRCIAVGLRRRFNFEAAYISDDLPDFFLGHTDPLAGGSIGWHGGPRDSLVDGSEQISVRTSVTLVGTGQVGPAASAARAQAVAKRAVNAELKFARMRRFSIPCKRIAVLSGKRRRQQQQQHSAHWKAGQPFRLQKPLEPFHSRNQHRVTLLTVVFHDQLRKHILAMAVCSRDITPMLQEGGSNKKTGSMAESHLLM